MPIGKLVAVVSHCNTPKLHEGKHETVLCIVEALSAVSIELGQRFVGVGDSMQYTQYKAMSALNL